MYTFSERARRDLANAHGPDPRKLLGAEIFGPKVFRFFRILVAFLWPRTTKFVQFEGPPGPQRFAKNNRPGVSNFFLARQKVNFGVRHANVYSLETSMKMLTRSSRSIENCPFYKPYPLKKKLSVEKTKKMRNACGGIGTPWRRYLSYRDGFYTVL